MGIIVSGFRGCGCSRLVADYGDKVRIFDARGIGHDSVVSSVMSIINENDIVIISSDRSVREAFNSENVDYDIFYPTKARRGEFLLNEVRKRSNPTTIRELDSGFDRMVDEIEYDTSPACHKHVLSSEGEFIGNSEVIVRYLESIINGNNNNIKQTD